MVEGADQGKEGPPWPAETAAAAGPGGDGGDLSQPLTGEAGDEGAAGDQSEHTDLQQDEAKDGPPDGGWGWMVVLGATVTHFMLVGMARCLGVVYVALREKYQSTSASTALVAAAFNTARTLPAPLASLLCEKFGCRPVAFCGGLLFSAGMIISAFSTSLLHFFFSFGIIAGLGGVMVFTPAYIMVGKYFDRRKGTAMGLATIGSGLGHVVLAPLINYLMAEYSQQGTMLLLGGATLHTCAVALLYRPRRSRKRGAKKESGEEKQGPEQESKEMDQVHGSLRSLEDPDFKVHVKTGQETKEDTKKCQCCVSPRFHTLPQCSKDSLFCNCTFIIYCFLMAGMQYAVMGTLVFVPGFAVENKNVDKAKAALLLSIYGFVDLGSRFMYAFLFDLKVIRKRRRYPFSVAGLLFGASTILLAFMTSYESLAVGVAINALVEAAFHSQRATIISEFVPSSQASVAVGLMIASQGVGNITGPPFAGFLRDIYGSHSICFLFGGGVFSLAALAFALRMLCQSQRCKSSACCSRAQGRSTS